MCWKMVWRTPNGPSPPAVSGVSRSRPISVAKKSEPPWSSGPIAAFDGVDILVNVAGITRSHPSEVYPVEDWDLTLAVNLTAMFHLCKLVAQDMIPRRSGAIINVSSIGGALGLPE